MNNYLPQQDCLLRESEETILLKKWEQDNQQIRCFLDKGKIRVLLQAPDEKEIILEEEDIHDFPHELKGNLSRLRSYLDCSGIQIDQENNGYAAHIRKLGLPGAGLITSDTSKYWPNGIVPYEIDEKDFPKGSAEREEIEAAITYWNTNSPFKFIPKTNQNNYVTIGEVPLISQGKCYSNQVGMGGGEQDVQCDLHSKAFTKGNMIHELGHVIGLEHEHQRKNRNQLLAVSDDSAKKCNDEDNYGILKTAIPVGMHDLFSFMHYSIRNCIKLTEAGKELLKKEGKDIKAIGQREGFSPGDIDTINYLFYLSCNVNQKRAPSDEKKQSSSAIKSTDIPRNYCTALYQQAISLLNYGHKKEALLSLGKLHKVLRIWKMPKELFAYGKAVIRDFKRPDIALDFLNAIKSPLEWYPEKVIPLIKQIEDDYLKSKDYKGLLYYGCKIGENIMRGEKRHEEALVFFQRSYDLHPTAGAKKMIMLAKESIALANHPTHQSSATTARSRHQFFPTPSSTSSVSSSGSTSSVSTAFVPMRLEKFRQ